VRESRQSCFRPAIQTGSGYTEPPPSGSALHKPLLAQWLLNSVHIRVPAVAALFPYAAYPETRSESRNPGPAMFPVRNTTRRHSAAASATLRETLRSHPHLPGTYRQIRVAESA